MQKKSKKSLHINPTSNLKDLTNQELDKVSGSGSPFIPKQSNTGGDGRNN